MTEIRSNCRCCVAGCGIIAEVVDGAVIKVRGDVDHPLSRGYLCPKGSSLPWSHHRPDRLDHPLLMGRPVSWNVLLDDLAGRIETLIAAHGPDAFGLYEGNGTATDSLGRPTLVKLFRGLGSTQDYSAATIDVTPTWKVCEFVTGSRRLLPRWHPENPQGRMVVWIGGNPLISHGYNTSLPDPVRRIREFLARGGTAWVIDPKETRTSQVARHLRIRPGTDAALLAWLVMEQFDQPDSEQAFLGVPRDLVARLRAAVSRYDLNHTSSVTAIPPGDLIEFRDDLRRAGRYAIIIGTGVTFERNAMVTDWLRWLLLIMTDSLDHPAGMYFNPGWLDPLDQRRQPMARETESLPPPASRPELNRVFGEIPVVALTDEIQHGILRGLLVSGGNPISSFPDPERTREALSKLDLLAVADVLPTSTSAIATHVLPVAGQLERSDLMQNERITVVPAVLPPNGNRRPTWWIVGQLGRRLGLDILDGRDPDDVDEVDLQARAIIGGREEPDAVLAAGSHGLPIPKPYGYVKARLLEGGNWNAVPETLLERLETLVLPGHDRLMFVAGRQQSRNNSMDFVPPARQREGPELAMHPQDADARGLVDGDAVAVASEHGAETAQVRLDERVGIGTVSAAHGWATTNVSRLTTPADPDPISGQPVMTAIPVQVSRAEHVGGG